MHIAPIFSLPFAIPFWIVFFFAFVREGRVIQGSFASPPSEQDAGTFRALVIGSPLALLAAVAVSFCPWSALPDPALAAIAGMALLIAGAVLRRLCFNALGKSFTGTVVVAPGQAIVQHGPYRFVRHPSYTAAFLMFIGIGLALASGLSLAILFGAHAFLYGRRVAAEERALVATLGAPYRDYMARTRRFIPFLI